MAGLGARFVLLCIVVCFLVNVCESRGGRGGGRFGGRYRSSRVRGGSYSSSGGGGGADAGKIVGIVFGVIGGTIFLIIMYYVCKAYACSDSSENVAKYSGSNGVVIARQPAATTTTTNTTVNTITNDTTTLDDSDKTSPNYNGVLPPSYDSAVNSKDGCLPYPAYPNGDASYPPASSYPAEPAGLPYPSNPAEMAYPPPNAAAAPAPGIGFREDGTGGSAYSSDQGRTEASAPSYV